MLSRSNIILPCLNPDADTEIWAAQFAAQIGVSLIILKRRNKGGILGRLLNKSEREEEKTEEIAERMQGIREQNKIDVRVEWVHEAYSDLLPELVKKHSAGFIVLNALNAEGKYNPQVSKILARAEVSVISLRPGISFKPVSHLLLPLDLSPESRQKVSKAVALARRFDAQINVFSTLWDVDDAQIRLRLKQQMKQVRSFLSESKVKASCELVENPGHKETARPALDYLEKHPEMDMVLIMARRGEGSIFNKPGPEVVRVISNAHVPVLCVVPKVIGDMRIRSF